MLKNKNKQIANENTYTTGRKVYQSMSVIILAVLMVAGTLALGPIILKTAKNPEQFRDWIDGYGIGGRFIFVGIQILQVLFALIPGEVIEVGAGYAYGPWEGLFLCMVGVAIGSAIAFFLVRKLGKRLAEILMSSDRLAKIQFLKNDKKLTFIVFVLYFVPGTPKDLLTYFVGLTKMKTLTFILITTFARIPSILSSTYAGSTLHQKNYLAFFVIFGVTAVISILGLLLYRYITKRRESK